MTYFQRKVNLPLVLHESSTGSLSSRSFDLHPLVPAKHPMGDPPPPAHHPLVHGEKKVYGEQTLKMPDSQTEKSAFVLIFSL